MIKKTKRCDLSVINSLKIEISSTGPKICEGKSIRMNKSS